MEQLTWAQLALPCPPSGRLAVVQNLRRRAKDLAPQNRGHHLPHQMKGNLTALRGIGWTEGFQVSEFACRKYLVTFCIHVSDQHANAYQ